jgi:hypothetical protein
MSTFKQKKELNSTLSRMKAANKEKKGSFSPQQIGRVQYKLNQLAADPKGNAVRSKPKGKQKVGSVIKTGTGGTVRQKPKANLPKKKRIISKGTATTKKTGGHPSAKPRVHVQRKQTGSPSAERLSHLQDKPMSYSAPRKKTPKKSGLSMDITLADGTTYKSDGTVVRPKKTASPSKRKAPKSNRKVSTSTSKSSPSKRKAPKSNRK